MSEAAPANYWKLGLFVLSGLGVGLAVLAWLGVSSAKKDTFEVVTYFDESVQGLDVGAPVKLRGAKVGAVKAIGIAPDRRRIEVTTEIDRSLMRRLNLVVPEGQVVKIARDDLRIQLSQVGIAGTLFVLVDVVDPKQHPAPTLDFEPPPNYVPSMKSTFKDITEQLRAALERVPEVANRVNALLAKAERTLDDADVAGVSSRVKGTLDSANAVLEPLGPVAERLGQDDGLAMTVSAVREMAVAIRRAAADLDHLSEVTGEDLEVLRETLASFKALADMLEHDPGALLRGAAATSGPGGKK